MSLDVIEGDILAYFQTPNLFDLSYYVLSTGPDGAHLMMGDSGQKTRAFSESIDQIERLKEQVLSSLKKKREEGKEVFAFFHLSPDRPHDVHIHLTLNAWLETQKCLSFVRFWIGSSQSESRRYCVMIDVESPEKKLNAIIARAPPPSFDDQGQQGDYIETRCDDQGQQSVYIDSSIDDQGQSDYLQSSLLMTVWKNIIGSIFADSL